MGSYAYANIVFGVILCDEDGYAEGDPFYDFDDGVADWWKHVEGYKPLHNLYDEDGNYLDEYRSQTPNRNYYGIHLTDEGVALDKKNDIYKKEWEEANPLPYATAESGSSEGGSITILHIERLALQTSWDDVNVFDPKKLVATVEDSKHLVAFLHQYKLNYISEPSWMLTAYY